MKNINRCFLNKTNTVFLIFLLSIPLFSGCKQNGYEVNSGFIEAKLCNEDFQKWYAPLSLSGDACTSSSNAAIITFYSNHDFDFNHDVCTTISGSWNAYYTVNRSGQVLILDLTYMVGTVQQTESFTLKYSSESDVFYALDPDQLTLYPFEKVVFAP